MILSASHDFLCVYLFSPFYIYSIIPQLKVFELKSLIKFKSNAMVFAEVVREGWYISGQSTSAIWHGNCQQRFASCIDVYYSQLEKKRNILTRAFFFFFSNLRKSQWKEGPFQYAACLHGHLKFSE